MLSVRIDHELRGSLVFLLISEYRCRNRFHRHGLLQLLVLVPPHLLFNNLVVEGLPHLLVPGGLLGGQGLADHGQPPRLVLRLRLGEAHEELVREDDGRDVLKLLSYLGRHIVLLEHLVARVEGRDDIN